MYFKCPVLRNGKVYGQQYAYDLDEEGFCFANQCLVLFDPDDPEGFEGESSSLDEFIISVNGVCVVCIKIKTTTV